MTGKKARAPIQSLDAPLSESPEICNSQELENGPKSFETDPEPGGIRGTIEGVDGGLGLGVGVNALLEAHMSQDGILQPGGDILLPLLLRESYVEAMRDEAEHQGVSLSKHLQTLLDWWVENEYAQIARR